LWSHVSWSRREVAFISFPASSGNILLALVVALQAVIVTYDGWYSAIYFMEEDRDPLTPDFSLAMAFASNFRGS